MTPSDPKRPRRDDDLVVAALVEEHVEIDRDVIEIEDGKWAIHGLISYDGEVIAATFASEADARAALARLEDGT
ncbi:MAG TPA: hypothetical protein VH986_00585 [Acidimicrobiia bacterium]|jgi:hypothetical protein